MRKTIIKKANSSLTAAFGMLVILIFITAMKYPAEKKKSYSYLALGDSYTIGEQVAVRENFPNQVRSFLAERKLKIKAPAIIAETGWTTDELQDAIDKAKIKDHYDFVSLLIGVNNQYRGREKAEYARDFENLLKQAIQFAGSNASHVIVLSIPDWGSTPFAEGRNRGWVAKEIDAFNTINKEIASRYNVNYVDITPGTKKAAQDPSLLAADGLHPSGKEYAKWAGLIAEIIMKNL